jgi:hypothetical protein
MAHRERSALQNHGNLWHLADMRGYDRGFYSGLVGAAHPLSRRCGLRAGQIRERTELARPTQVKESQVSNAMASAATTMRWCNSATHRPNFSGP